MVAQNSADQTLGNFIPYGHTHDIDKETRTRKTGEKAVVYLHIL